MSTTIKFVTVPSKTLATSINASTYAIQVSDIIGWDGNALTSANFGDVLWCVLRNSANSQMEIMQLDPTTIANTSITVLKRGLDFSGGTTEVPANMLTWVKNDTTVELGSNPPQLLAQGVMVSGNQTIADLKTFTTLPQSSTAPTSPNDFVNKAYADQLTIAGAPPASTSTMGVAKLSVAAQTSKGTVTMTIASPCVVSFTAHGLIAGDTIKFSTTGSLPTGITAGTTYYVISAGLTSNAFEISTSSGGSAVNTSGSQSGVHTLIRTTPFVVETDDPRVSPNNATTATGSANAYVVTLATAPTAYTTYQVYGFIANFAITSTTPTVNFNGLGAKTLKKADGSALAVGEIIANQFVQCVYDGTSMLVLSTLSTTVTVASMTFFQDGSDGAAVFDGSGAVTGATGPTTNVYTLTRDVYYTDATISTGVTVNPNGWRMFGTGTLTMNGTAKIARNGNNGSNASNAGYPFTPGNGGAALPDGFLAGSPAGGNGGQGAIYLSNGSVVAIQGGAGISFSSSLGSSGATGGSGGAATAVTAGTPLASSPGGVGGVATGYSIRLMADWHLSDLLDISTSGSVTKMRNGGSSGGGGGGGVWPVTSGDGGGSGGGAGSSGGVIAIFFKFIVLSASATITAIGGNGGNGGNAAVGGGGNNNAGGGGGGGGGNGGQIVLAYYGITNPNGSASFVVTAGTGGTGGAKAAPGNPSWASNGSNGSNGTAGNVRTYQLVRPI